MRAFDQLVRQDADDLRGDVDGLVGLRRGGRMSVPRFAGGPAGGRLGRRSRRPRPRRRTCSPVCRKRNGGPRGAARLLPAAGAAGGAAAVDDAGADGGILRSGDGLAHGGGAAKPPEPRLRRPVRRCPTPWSSTTRTSPALARHLAGELGGAGSAPAPQAEALPEPATPGDAPARQRTASPSSAWHAGSPAPRISRPSGASSRRVRTP